MTAAAPASTATVAQELAALCRQGRNLDAIDKLYSPNIVSIEPVGDETTPPEMHGIDAVRGKNTWWFDNHEVHSAEVNGPFVGDRQFAVQYDFDVTFKPTGQRFALTEMALYTVKDGKVVREQFFYNMPSPPPANPGT
jgi:ketosteroid isomerase-like protein